MGSRSDSQYSSVIAPAAAGVLIALALASCGGGGGNPASPPYVTQRSPRASMPEPITASQIPQVAACLAQLSATLRGPQPPSSVDLGCADGSYVGTTPTGQPCTLTVDALRDQFSFTFLGVVVAIAQAQAAIDPSGQTVSSVESTDLGPQQPGILIARYQSSPAPETESIALRTVQASGRGGRAAAIGMSYLRSDAGGVQIVNCLLGPRT